MTEPSLLLAYIGPDQMLPVASAFAAAMGVVLMFWRFFLNMVMRPFSFVFRRKDAAGSGGGVGAAVDSESAITPENQIP